MNIVLTKYKMNMTQPTNLISRYVRKKLMKYIRNYSAEQVILTKEVEKAGVVILNRPHALNAINPPMLDGLMETLSKWENKKKIVVIKGAGTKAFCAGGDIVQALEVFKRARSEHFLYKYSLKLNELLYLLHTYKIPIISIVDGIAYGGGAGIALFSKYPIVTENTLLSMPEVKFGFHPNAGASYFFNKLDVPLCNFLALTGFVLKGADLLHIGYSKNFCYSSNLNKIEEELLNSSVTDDENLIIEKYCNKNIPESFLAPIIDDINRCFSGETVEDIISKLTDDNSIWAKEIKSLLETYAPTSIKVILRQMQLSRNMDLKDCLVLENNLTPNFYTYTDVIEGTKAILIDKTYKPKWNPSKLSDVTEELIQSHFKSISDASHRETLSRRDISRYK